MSLRGPDARGGHTETDLLELAREAAVRAGDLLLERFESGPERRIEAKSTPTDLVSDADLAAQQVIRGLIGERRPDDAFLGEEEGADEPGSSGLCWVVDPLDGTINFLFGIPQWCVSVAVRDARGTIAGVIVDPVAGEIFSAARGGAPMCNGAPIVARMPRATSLGRALVATGFAYDEGVRGEQAHALAGLLPRVRDIRRAGAAALDLAWTAMGRHDAYFERTVKAWDIEAGALICECAGLEVRVHDDTILVAPAALADELAALAFGPGQLR